MGMSEPVRIHVSYSTQSGKLGGVITIVGEEGELFRSAVIRAVREQLDANHAGTPYGVRWQDPDYPDSLHAIFPEKLTMGAAREYFGDEIDADPPTIHVDEGGYGGAPEYVAYAIDLVSAGMTIGGYVTATLGAQRAALKVRYRRARELAKDWNDGDYISPELRDVVHAQWVWPRRRFDRVFGLDASRGPLLLRRLGYERRDNHEGVEEWVRVYDEDGSRF